MVVLFLESRARATVNLGYRCDTLYPFWHVVLPSCAGCTFLPTFQEQSCQQIFHEIASDNVTGNKCRADPRRRAPAETRDWDASRYSEWWCRPALQSAAPRLAPSTSRGGPMAITGCSAQHPQSNSESPRR